MSPTERLPRSRIGKTAIALILLAGVAAGLNSGLRACASGRDDQAARPLSAAELARLAAMRQRNFDHGHVAIRGTVGKPGRSTSINGWIDWRRSLAYLSVSSMAEGSVALIQARPGVLAIRPEKQDKTGKNPAASAKPAGPPPATPPADGWRVRPIRLSEKEKTPLENLITFLFLLGRDKLDRQDLLGKLSNRWLRKDKIGGTEVDVLLGPAVLPEFEPPQPLSDPSQAALQSRTGTPAPSQSPSQSQAAQIQTAKPDPGSLDTYGGAVGYWLDAEGQLRKVETLLGPSLPVAVDFDRGDKTEIEAIASLGGRDIEPAAVSGAEAEMLTVLRQRDFHAHYAELTLTLPVMAGTLRTASGWLDWQRGVSYLSIVDADDAGGDSLVHANKTQVSKKKPEARAPQKPPLPAPKGGWNRTAWSNVGTDADSTDLDVLLFEAIAMSSQQRDDAKRIRANAHRLRVDTLHGEPVGVFELPNVLQQQWTPGTARVRYWVDNAGVLRRLEIRTGTGAFAQLDIKPVKSIPSLPAAVQ